MIRDLLLNCTDRNRIAVMERTRNTTYLELVKQTEMVRGQLPLQTRAHIAIFLPDGGSYIAALFAVYMAGMTAFPLNSRLTRHEIMPLLKQASVSVVLTSGLFRELWGSIGEEMETLTVIDVDDIPDCGHSIQTPVRPADPDQPMLMLTTSGTTGKAKIVMLSERNFEHSVLAYIDKMDFESRPEEETKFVMGTPLSAIYGLMVLTACLIKSFPIVILGDVFTLDMFYKVVEEHRVTHYEGGVSVGLMMEQMAGRPIPYDISSLRYFGVAGSKITGDTLLRLIEAYPGTEYWPGYGMTEASPLISKPYKKVRKDKLDSVGTVIRGMTVMLDVDGILTDKPYIRGEVVAKGPNIMMGYYENEEETRRIIKDGYLYTGDIGYFDEDGYLYLCGRKKNVIMTRGFSVYAEEIEACIMNSRLVKDCVVYGEQDTFGNEVVCADLVLRFPDIQMSDIHLYCQEHLSGYKQPQRLKIVDEIKKTVTGKIERPAKAET